MENPVSRLCLILLIILFALFTLSIGVVTLPAASAKDMPIPHFNESMCECEGFDWPVTSGSAPYGLALGCSYEKEKTARGSQLDWISFGITSWYDPEDAKEALEIFRDYDYKREKSGYGEGKVYVEDINSETKISFIYRGENPPTQYNFQRKIFYGTNSIISIAGFRTQQKEQTLIDDEVVGWLDALEACAKSYIDNQDISFESVNGKLSVLGFPIKHAVVYVEDDPELRTTTDASGAFKLKVPNEDYYTLVFELQYEKNNHIFFRVIGENREEPMKIVMDVSDGKINSMELDFGDINYPIENVDHELSAEIKLEEFFTQESGLQGVPVHYLHMQEALEYYTDVAKVDLSKNTVDLLPYAGEGASYEHENDRQWILIDQKKSSFDNQHRPFIHYHEFTHYVQHVLLGSGIDAYLDGKNINHGGYANEKTSDSFSEGLGAYMATVIANHYNRHWADEYDKQPSLYPLVGSLEQNYAAWQYRGQAEEYAIASILWDLTDGSQEAVQDSSVKKDMLRKTMTEQIKASDFNNDGSWDQSEFIHSLLDQGEYNPDYDDYYDEQETLLIAQMLTEESKTQSLAERMMGYAKTDSSRLAKAEMHKFIKDNLELFKSGLTVSMGADFTGLPSKITLDALMAAVEDAPDDDNMDLTESELWKIISKPHSDFTSVYNDLVKAYPTKKKNIDGIFVRHGFFMDLSEGDKLYNDGEPYLDENENKRKDASEPFVDLGGMRYTGLEKIGTASNYQRPSRKSSIELDGQFVKANPEVPYYTEDYTVYNVNYHGLMLPSMTYQIRASNEEGMIYVPIPPEAQITIAPEGVTTENPLEFSSTEFNKVEAEAVEEGFFAEQDFKYTGELREYDTFRKRNSSALTYLLISAAVMIAVVSVLFLTKKKGKKR